ncbi:MAG: HepT-like ribonuclease domain-containing protein [Betaproteobacteria bacterium]
MNRDDPDVALLEDMLRFAREAIALVDGIGFEDYSGDAMRRRALERVLELMGEVARKVSDVRQGRHAEVPWRKLVGQRNILAHMYGRVDQFQLYRTATEDLQALVETVIRILEEPDDAAR